MKNFQIPGNIETILIFITLAMPLRAEIINIPADQPTIQSGITAANRGDTVLVQPGIYRENINFTGKAITAASLYILTGDTAFISQTVIDGNQNGSVVTFENGEDSGSILIGFTIKNGQGQGLPNSSTGGGITCLNASSPVLQNLIITGNTTSSNFGRGGGIYCQTNSSPTITDVQIFDNFANSGGGGIYLRDNANPTLSNVIIINNTSNGIAGGLYCDQNCKPYLFRTIIAGNVATDRGGGIYCTNSDPIFINITLSNNTSTNEGGGIFCDGSHPIAVNSILWNNVPDQIFLFPDPVPSSFTGIHSDIDGGWAGTGNINQAPIFEDPTSGIFNLGENSPCIDAGVAFWVNGNDTLINLNADEYIGAAPDMGAIEFGTVTSVTDLPVITARFQLVQNYPNPFNPSTTIPFVLPYASHITLNIFDLTGRQVRTLVTGEFPPGRHEVVWDGKTDAPADVEVAGGVYFYRLQAGAFVQVRKMLILR